jgi:hypothetical protein
MISKIIFINFDIESELSNQWLASLFKTCKKKRRIGSDGILHKTATRGSR